MLFAQASASISAIVRRRLQHTMNSVT